MEDAVIEWKHMDEVEWRSDVVKEKFQFFSSDFLPKLSVKPLLIISYIAGSKIIKLALISAKQDFKVWSY